MGFLDFLGLGNSGSPAGAGADPEAARLRALGQDVPSGVTFEGPNDYVDPAEQHLLFPSGLPTRDKSGGLAQLSALSRYADLMGGGPGTGGTVGSPPHTAPATTPATPAGSQVGWFNTAPDAFAQTERDRRQLEQWENLAGDVGKWVRTAATAYAGGGV